MKDSQKNRDQGERKGKGKKDKVYFEKRKE